MKCLTGIVSGALLLMMPAAHASVAAEVGSAQMIRGTVTATLQEQDPRTLQKTSPVFETDMIKTGAKSFAVIKLKDGTRITIRPDSELGIKKYTFEEGKEEAEYNLVKGGMRALTGLMGKSNPDATSVKTQYATMGIRGTSYDVRMCDADCVAEQQQKAGIVKLTSLVIGRSVNLQGKVTVIDSNGVSRQLTEGGPVYAGDRVRTEQDASTLLVFRDDTRLALMANSDLELSDYSYEAEGTDRFDANLKKGDLQVKPGLIAKDYPAGFTLTKAGQPIDHENNQLNQITDVDIEELFGVEGHDFNRPGAYITVYDGHINVHRNAAQVANRAMVASLGLLSGFELLAQATSQPEFIDLGRGEAAFVDEENLYRIAAPLFMTEDCYPHPDEMSENYIWPPIFFQGDACSEVYSVYVQFGVPSIWGGPTTEPGFDQPLPPKELPIDPEKPQPKPPIPEQPD